jgi:hypothetical protein
MKISSISNLRWVLLLVAMIGLAACGGGSDDSSTSTDGDTASDGDTSTEVTTATGVFKDSNVSGLSFESGSQSGITDSNGLFTYEVGEPVTFKIGPVIIGQTTGKAVVTPIDLVPDGTSSTEEVLNIVRFLMMLDIDSDPFNGIVISEAVRSISENWSQVDFGSSDFESEVASIISDATSVDGVLHYLPPVDFAQLHIESTLRCVFSGGFSGTFDGDDNGQFGVIVEGNSGFVRGFAFSNNSQSIVTLSGQTAVSLDQFATFVSGDSSTGATYSGSLIPALDINSPDMVKGTWQNTLYSLSGSFDGTRVGGVYNADYRFTGTFGGSDGGLFTFDLFESNDGADYAVSGKAYSLYADELFDLTGSVTGTTLTATASNGTVITGTLDTLTGALSGEWENTAEGLSGVYGGSGCKLN